MSQEGPKECPLCHGELVFDRDYVAKGKHGKVDISVAVPSSVCSGCGEAFTTPEQYLQVYPKIRKQLEDAGVWPRIDQKVLQQILSEERPKRLKS